MNSEFHFSLRQLKSDPNKWEVLSAPDNKGVGFEINGDQLTRTNTGIKGVLRGESRRYYWDRNYEDTVQYEIHIDIDR